VLVRAIKGRGLDVDLSLVIAGFDFERGWKRRRIFRVGAVRVPVARFVDIVESKHRAGRTRIDSSSPRTQTRSGT